MNKITADLKEAGFDTRETMNGAFVYHFRNREVEPMEIQIALVDGISFAVRDEHYHLLRSGLGYYITAISRDLLKEAL